MSGQGELVLRDGAPQDAALLAAFWRERYAATFGHLYRPEDLAAFFTASYGAAQQGADLAEPGSAHRLVFQDGALCSACQTGPLKLPIDPGDVRAWELRRLYLTAAQQGSGLADQLMDWAFNEARARGAEAIYLGAWERNHRALAFYRRHGFAVVGRYLYPVGEARDEELILRRPL